MTTTPAGTPSPTTTVTVCPFTVRVVVPGPVVSTRRAASSSAIAPVPLAAARVAFTGALNVTTTVSFASSSASPAIRLVRRRSVVPG